MKLIKIKKRISDNFGDSIAELFRVIEMIYDLPQEEEVIIDMNDCKFLTPPFLLGLMLIIKKLSQSRFIHLNNKFIDQGFGSYLTTIHFENGLQPELIEGDYDSYLSQFEHKTYIPIINFPATRLGNDTGIRDGFLSTINNLLSIQLLLRGDLKTAIMYLIDEAVNNIVDHSREKRGYIFAQYYKDKLFMDICIADTGITILGTYQEKGVAFITTDKDAIAYAANGKSTKENPENEGRGYGIPTSKRMLVEGLGGKYFLCSGRAFLIKTRIKEEIIALPSSLQWPGTLVVLRIPVSKTTGFDPSIYYE